MASSEVVPGTDGTGAAEQQPTQQDAAQPAADAAPSLDEASEIQAALAGMYQHFMSASAGLTEEVKVLAVIARKGPEAVARELPRRIAGSTVRILAGGFNVIAQLTALISTLEARIEALEEADDLGDIVGSVEDLYEFLTDVLAMCKAYSPFALKDEEKELLASVQGRAEEMVGRMDVAEEESTPAEGDAAAAAAELEPVPGQAADEEGEESDDAT